MIELLVPELPESVADATVASWLKKVGDFVERDEVVVEIETDKVVLEVPASVSGVLQEIIEEEGSTVLSKQLLGKMVKSDAPTETQSIDSVKTNDNIDASPSVRRVIVEKDLDANTIKGTGKGGAITLADVEKHIKAMSAKNAPEQGAAQVDIVKAVASRSDKRIPMTRLRKRVAERLLEAKNSTAMLTTFNEVNMKPIMDLREQYQEIFEKKHGVRLGYMSFYIKAVTEALKRFPEINAAIDGDDIVYHNFFDISIAVSTPRGLVTPVLHDTDTLNMPEIETAIKTLAIRGRDGKLSVDEMIGGNFTITNGGVFGSLLSTPIINLPQAAILGMHKIQDRPMAVDGEVKILPMMYLALSYDHRLVDGKESVSFLVAIKDLLEDPTRLLLDI
ncbi:MAG: 2-oxoglutarate dehydrogenase complex dihydrolipoyllysine-residue succinyltransferase [Psychromonas sp.]|nr:2-oxoglutarate dehydrogenase complex dihydrolipoyllysine-residue succinyltransferase [Psychromonas sp.]